MLLSTWMYTRKVLLLNDNQSSMLADTLMQFDTKNAHAYLVFGDREQNQKELEDYFTRMDIDTHQNPDVFLFLKSNFGIPDVRNITSIVSKTNAKLDTKYVTISTNAMTVEAQNALLKTIEEPASPTIFFILLPAGGYVLETIRSRVQTIITDDADQYGTLVQSFLKTSFTERMDLLDTFYPEGDDPKKPKLAKGRASLFLQELETEIARLVTTKTIDPGVYTDYTEITMYILDRSANVKQILEYVALRMPVIK